MFTVCLLVGKVAKVAYITRVNGCAHCLIFIFVYALSVAKVADGKRLVWGKGPIPCLVYVCTWLLSR